MDGLLLRRRLMMDRPAPSPGLAYYTETVTIGADSGTLTVNHNLGTENVFVFIRDTGSQIYGISGTFSIILVPKILTSQLDSRTNVYLFETRTTSSTSGYYVGSFDANSSFSQNSVVVYTRSSTYPFLSGHTYEIKVVAIDVLSPSGVKYKFSTVELNSTSASVSLPNAIGKTNVFGLIVHQNPVFYQNRVLASVAQEFLAGVYYGFAAETRTAWNNVNFYSATSGSISLSSVVFGVRNGSYPFDTGKYNTYLIEIPT